MQQRGVRRANRGKRRPLAGAMPWWWDYPRIAAQLNPYQIDWYTFTRMPRDDYELQRRYVEGVEAFKYGLSHPTTRVVIRFANDTRTLDSDSVAMWLLRTWGIESNAAESAASAPDAGERA